VALREALTRLIRRQYAAAECSRTNAEANGRAMSGIHGRLSSSKNYPASALLDGLEQAVHPKQAYWMS